jgi:hypothetical protein
MIASYVIDATLTGTVRIEEYKGQPVHAKLTLLCAAAYVSQIMKSFSLESVFRSTQCYSSRFQKELQSEVIGHYAVIDRACS